jgi:hypothetical protein
MASPQFWSPSAPTCSLIANYCDTNPTVSNGNVTITNRRYQDTAPLVCNAGYSVREIIFLLMPLSATFFVLI